MLKLLLILSPIALTSYFIFGKHGFTSDLILMTFAGIASSIISYAMPKKRLESPEELHARACSRL